MPRATTSSRRLGWIVLAVALISYLIAVVNRTSLGVAGTQATERFGLTATTLAVFSVVQLTVYAAMQVPGGLMLDRFGARVLIAAGAITMAGGQLILALTESYPIAIVGRVLIGAGDAVTFISVIRLVTAWFEPRHVPVLSQVTGLVGQSGQIISAVPLVALLHARGWTTAFVTLAAAGVFSAAAAALTLRDNPPGTPTDRAARHLPIRAVLVPALKTPGTQLGFWSHFLAPFSANTFVLLWGFPFLIEGQLLTTAQASALLTIHTVVAMISGPLVGMYVARHPLRRSWAVIFIACLVAVAWAMVLIPATPRSFPVLMLFVALIATGGPASMVGFDYARTFNPATRLGTATGIVNVGGFTATIFSVLAVGLVLSWVAPPRATSYTLADYRLAFCALAIPWVIGMVGILTSRRRTRQGMAADGVVVPPLREVLARRHQKDGHHTEGHHTEG